MVSLILVDFVQGEIDSDASKDSKDPTLVSEPLSAPDELKKIQLELEIQKVRAEEKLISQKRKMFPAGRKQNQEQKEGTDEQLQQEMVGICSLNSVCELNYIQGTT